MRFLQIFGVALVAVGGLYGAAYALGAPGKGSASSVLYHLALEGGTLTVVSERRLDSAMRRPIARPGPDTRVRVVLVSDRGKVLYERGIADPFELRGEWPAQDGGGRIEGVHLRKTGRVDFTVTVPQLEAAAIAVLAVPQQTPRMLRYEPRAFAVVGQAELPRKARP
ncbi:MAG: hypothetical protein MUC50_15200 [Myxococcota bacterium]|jgi:hypothetical protein|nr:hypothetical protein [Myxococcota bacterium]